MGFTWVGTFNLILTSFSIKVELLNSLITTVYIRTTVSFTISIPGKPHSLLFLYLTKIIMFKKKESVVLFTS